MCAGLTQETRAYSQHSKRKGLLRGSASQSASIPFLCTDGTMSLRQHNSQTAQPSAEGGVCLQPPSASSLSPFLFHLFQGLGPPGSCGQRHCGSAPWAGLQTPHPQIHLTVWPASGTWRSDTAPCGQPVSLGLTLVTPLQLSSLYSSHPWQAQQPVDSIWQR